ncbi:MAG: hypothetical protein H6555_08685 [Lewinellaceae bacterium]|nr:hypothetical protein [Lewinellaceae bacterium]
MLPDRQCIQCGEGFRHGRADKKFCSAFCRTTFHNQRYRRNQLLRQRVNQLLRRNHQILQEINPEGRTRVRREVMIQRGFNFAYITHLATVGKDKPPLRCCYDQGYYLDPNGWVELRGRKTAVTGECKDHALAALKT